MEAGDTKVVPQGRIIIEEVNPLNRIREGMIPTVLGTAVTAAGIAMQQNRKIDRMISNTVFGFGLAHIVLGAIDLVEHRNEF